MPEKLSEQCLEIASIQNNIIIKLVKTILNLIVLFSNVN